MAINQIIEGHYKKIMNKEDTLRDKRITICKSCKLYKIDDLLGEVCNKRLYLNPKTNETSVVKKDGFKNGCGCILQAKTRVKDAKCPINKW